MLVITSVSAWPLTKPSTLSERSRSAHDGPRNRLALVTGSTAGIGFAIAEKLIHQGVDVIINGRTQARVDRAIEALPTALLKRFLRPEEIGAFVAFLASEAASGITGAALRVDGGVVKSITRRRLRMLLEMDCRDIIQHDVGGCGGVTNPDITPDRPFSHQGSPPMKFCRYGPRGQEKPGLVDDQGRIRDLSGVVDDLTPETLARAGAADPAALPIVDGAPRHGVPLKGIGKIVAIGLNYEDHAIESNLPIPTEPVMFMKSLSSLTGPNDEVMLPRDSTHSDWEVELGVIIRKTCRYVDEAKALDHVAGYVLANDVSERFNQKQRGSQWSKGKGHDTFCPVGPWLVTPDEIADPQALDMWLDLNGERMQTGNTRTMIFSIKQIIAYLSQYITLFPGDLVITGTPPGVGEGKKPAPIFLKAGDQMRLSISGLGIQTQPVVAWRHLGDEVLA